MSSADIFSQSAKRWCSISEAVKYMYWNEIWTSFSYTQSITYKLHQISLPFSTNDFASLAFSRSVIDTEFEWDCLVVKHNS